MKRYGFPLLPLAICGVLVLLDAQAWMLMCVPLTWQLLMLQHVMDRRPARLTWLSMCKPHRNVTVLCWGRPHGIGDEVYYLAQLSHSGWWHCDATGSRVHAPTRWAYVEAEPCA